MVKVNRPNIAAINLVPGNDVIKAATGSNSSAVQGTFERPSGFDKFSSVGRGSLGYFNPVSVGQLDLRVGQMSAAGAVERVAEFGDEGLAALNHAYAELA